MSGALSFGATLERDDAFDSTDGAFVKFSSGLRWLLILLVVAVALIAFFVARTSSRKPSPTVVPPTASADAPSPPRVDPIPDVPRVAADQARSPSPRWMPPPMPSADDRAIVIDLQVPVEASNGTTVEASIGVPPGPLVEVARFRIDYDADALEPIEVVDPNGTTLPAIPTGPGSIELEFDLNQGLQQPTIVRFQARASVPRVASITVTPELRDAAGNALLAPPAINAVTILP
jgi:hypothetical protein